MSELEAEKVDLQRANERIKKARQVLEHQSEIYQRTQELGVGAEEAGNLLQAMQQSLSEMVEHRRLILERIRALGGEDA